MRGAEAHERFREIVLPHVKDGLALARWLVASRHDAEDIVQDACLRALAAIDSYEGRGARAWFLTIVRNTSFTWLTKNRPKDLVQVADMSELDSHPPSSVDDKENSNPETMLLKKLEDAAMASAIENCRILCVRSSSSATSMVEFQRNRHANRADRDCDVAPRARPRSVVGRHRKRRPMMSSPKSDWLLLNALVDQELDAGGSLSLETPRT